MNIVEMLRVQSRTRPDGAAIVEARRGRANVFTFSELARASAQAAALMRRSGLEPGDAVLVMYPMSAEMYIALLAIFQLGLVAVFLDLSAGRDHIERCCALYPPKGMIASSRAHLLRVLSPSMRAIPVKFAVGCPVPGAVWWGSARRLATYEGIHRSGSETRALLTFTSGSTGRPKAAVRTHGFLLAQHRALVQGLGLGPDEIDLITLPMFVLANLASGVTSVMPDADVRHPGSIDPVPFVRQIVAHQPTRTAASPGLLERVADHCLQRRLTLPQLRRIFVGGAPVFPRLLGKLQSVAPRAEIVAVYGSTEAEPIAKIAHHEVGAGEIAAMLGGRGLLAGPPVSSIELRILRDQWGTPIGPFTGAEFSAVCQPAGERGEIVVSGAHVLPGYLNGTGDDETKFTVEGTRWHRTGDAGYVDEQGRVWLLGRCAARIDDMHGTIYPFTVECPATHYAGVHRAALIGQDGRRVLAIQPERGATVDLGGLKEAVAWACIDEMQLHGNIPVDRRHNAKIDYPALQEILTRSRAA